MVSSIRMSICAFEIKAFFCIDNVVVPLFSYFSITSNELHHKLCIMAFVVRRSSIASAILFIWHQVATGEMFLNAMTHLKLLSLGIAFINYLL